MARQLRVFCGWFSEARLRHLLHLYVILDIVSPCVIGWTIVVRENSTLVAELITHAAAVHGPPGSLHANCSTSIDWQARRSAAGRPVRPASVERAVVLPVTPPTSGKPLPHPTRATS